MELLTQRLTLRVVSYRDSNVLMQILNHPKVSQHNDYGKSLTLQDIKAMIQSDLELFYQGIGVRFILLKEGSVIGSIGLFDYQQSCSEISMGYELSPEHWNQGYMREAATCLIDSLHHILPKALILQVNAKVAPKNIRSINLLKYLGFEHKHDKYRLNLS
ncbi:MULTISPECIES: GNAT family N-acetyltransferase [Pseudoalteromonas]|uniref:Acetyltransferase n=1 Tax=Pseudoalteromonas luteoviolacea (strain 2ta16) TaxID=1353533 RepID=V4HVI2_PSEL2|nr:MULTISPECIES: GNAT family N-acetyltransferase [Pseudoalteromonas]ESP93788.1 acetyltransferase [Pseudoalteromonas luteoviolacea 2ta16]MCG7550764.1 GNAT family N-acetyltransferase [Pseudoalteromonas sp. Of7M-16]